MNVSIDKQPNCIVQLTADLPAEKVTSHRDRLINEFSKQARIPGFRPGKAPRNVIEKRYNAEISQELENKLISEGLDEALKEQKIDFLDVKDRKIEHAADGSATLKATLITSPEFELPEYKGLEITVPEVNITEDLVDEDVFNFRRRFAEFPEIEEARPTQEGDVLVIDYTSTIDGKPMAEAIEGNVSPYDAKDEYWVKVEEDSFLPGFGKELAGIEKDGEKTFSYTFPADFASEALQGKAAEYTVKVKQIMQENLPPLSEVIEKVMPNSDEEKFKGLVREQLEQRAEQQLQAAKHDQIYNALTSAVDFDLPEDFLTQETQMQTDRMVEQGMQYGMSEDDISGMQEDLIGTASDRAKNNLKSHFILNKIAEKEEINVSNEDVMARVNLEASQQNKKPKAYLKEIQQNGIYRIRQTLITDKVVDFLLSEAKVTTSTEETNDAE